jgi:hypothetical protein
MGCSCYIFQLNFSTTSNSKRTNLCFATIAFRERFMNKAGMSDSLGGLA